MSEMLICQYCQGEGKIQVLACGRDGCRPTTIPCFDCQGSGQRSPDAAAREAVGQTLREARKALRLTQREAAKMLGLQPSQVNDLEWGRDGSTIPMIEAATARLTAWGQSRQEACQP